MTIRSVLLTSGGSVRTFIQCELQRLKERRRDASEPLESLEAVQTLGDCIDPERLSRRLPPDWRLNREIVQFSGESVCEVVRLTDCEGYRITLKPLELCAPTDQIEIYTRRSPAHSRQRRRTSDSLAEARTVAVRIAAKRDSRRPKVATRPTQAQLGRQ